MAQKRYRAVIGQGHVSHPTIKSFVGYRRVIDKSVEDNDFVAPEGQRWRHLPDGELIQDSAYLRRAAAKGALEELPVELPEPEPEPELDLVLPNALKEKRQPFAAEGEDKS